MSQVGVIAVPKVRWGGRWAKELGTLEGSEVADWEVLATYNQTTAYQVARALNLGAALPDPPEGKVFEFGSRVESDGTSTLLVRTVDE